VVSVVEEAGMSKSQADAGKEALEEPTPKHKKSKARYVEKIRKSDSTKTVSGPTVIEYTVAEDEALVELEIVNRRVYICGLSRLDYIKPA
jgi:hypothetical protein